MSSRSRSVMFPFGRFTSSRRRRALWAPERLEPRLTLAADLLSVAAARPEAPGFPPSPELPIPAGATLIDVSDSGQQVLFSSTDPNIVPGQQTVPFLPGSLGNLFWMDLSAGTAEPVIRLVTHIAGSTTVSAGYTGIGMGIVDPFMPGTADLSGDGQTVVFDSPINAHTFDATVPVENDQPSNARLVVDGWEFPGQQPQAITVEGVGSIDVFVWHASAKDPANNLTAISLLNDAGKQAAIGQAAQYLFPVPDTTKPMMAGIFPEQPPLGFDPKFQLLEPTSAVVASHGISDDGRTILYSTNVPAPWLDTVNTNPAIADDVDPLVGQGWSVDGFVVEGADAVSAAALEGSGRTLTVTTYEDAGILRALGSYENQIPWETGFPWGTGFLPSNTFYPEYLQLSSNGNRVVYSTRVPSLVIVPQTTDADFSLDVFAYDIAADTTILVTTKAGQPTVAAGAGQSPFPVEQPGQVFSTLELFDSQNHSVSRDGLTVAVTSSTGNLLAGFVDNNVEFRPAVLISTVGSEQIPDLISKSSSSLPPIFTRSGPIRERRSSSTRPTAWPTPTSTPPSVGCRPTAPRFSSVPPPTTSTTRPSSALHFRPSPQAHCHRTSSWVASKTSGAGRSIRRSPRSSRSAGPTPPPATGPRLPPRSCPAAATCCQT